MAFPLHQCRWFAGVFLLYFVLSPAGAQEPAPVEIQMSVLPGLKFDVPRFAVAPGGQVKILLRNPDQMIHNLVITAPGARMEVVMAALALGADGPAQDFVPDSPKVLWHTKALNPGDTQELAFQAPAEEGVYPYVCTFTGHGMVMYGAMYVTTKPLPPAESDANIPQAAEVITDASDHSHHLLEKPVLSRTFLPDCGPAAIAIGLPGGQSYCFDAGLCRLRYVWRGGFVDNSKHWAGKGDEMGEVVGRIYYRAPDVIPWRIGSREHEPAIRWKGYRWQDGTPQLEYTVDGKSVREWAAPLHHGSGLQFTYEVAGAEPVYFIADVQGGAEFTASTGTWENGVLRLTAAEAKHFTVTLTERPGVEPLRYWSMNDLVFTNKKDPERGVMGNAFTPGGTDGKKRVLNTGIKMADLGRTEDPNHFVYTCMAWLEMDPRNRSPLQTIFAVEQSNLLQTTSIEAPGWHHLVVSEDGKSRRVYLDGTLTSEDQPGWFEPQGQIQIGSQGERSFFAGLLDEVRIYDRVLSPVEIRAIFEREAAHLPASERPSARQP